MTRPVLLRMSVLFYTMSFSVVIVGSLPPKLAAQPEPPETVRRRYNTLVTEGSKYLQNGEYVKASQPLETALELATTRLYLDDPNHIDVANLQHLLGETQAMALQYIQARTSLHEACARWRKNLKIHGVQRDTACAFVRCLVSQARLLRELGAYGEAVIIFEEADKLLNDAHLEQSIQKAETLFEYAQVRMKQHNRKVACDYISQSLSIMTDVKAPSEQILLAKRVLASNYVDSYSYDDVDLLDEAEKLLAQIEKGQKIAIKAAKSVNEKALAEYSYAEMLVTKANLQLVRRDYPAGKSTLKQAEDVFRRIDSGKLPVASRGLANCMVNKAVVSFILNQHEGAEAWIEEALKLRSVGDFDFAWESNARLSLGMFYYVHKQHEACKRELGKALDQCEAGLTNMFPFLSDRQRLVFLTEQRYVLDVWLSLATQIGVSDEEIWARVVNWKGRTFACHPAERYARRKPETRPLVEQYQQACQVLAYLRSRSSPTDKLGLQRQTEVERQIRALEIELERVSRVSMKEPEVRPHQIAACLPDGVTLLDYVEYIHFVADPKEAGRFAVELQMLAFVVRNDAKPVCIKLGSSKDLAAHIRDWRRLLDNGEAPHYPPKLNEEAKHIADIVWRPLASHLGSPQHIIVCPDGPLVHFSFAALPGKKDRSYLIDDVDISYAVSGRQVLQMFAANAESNPTSRKDALVIAGVYYDGTKNDNRLADLSDTLHLGKKVKEMFEETHLGESAHLLSGKATRDQFVEKMHGAYRMISCVLHGECPRTRRVKVMGLLRHFGIERDSLTSILDIKLIFSASEDNKLKKAPSFLTGSELAVMGINPELLAFLSCGLADGVETNGLSAVFGGIGPFGYNISVACRFGYIALTGA